MSRTALTLLLLISISWAGYTITGFSSGNSYPQLQTNFLESQNGEYLTEVFSPQQIPMLRRRFSTDEYRLYRGNFKSQSRSSLNFHTFIRPRILSRNNFYRTKFYARERLNSSGDLTECYFHGDTLFVESFVQVSYNVGGVWKKMYSTTSGEEISNRSGDIAITTSPAGADIYLDGIRKGVVTPNYITEISAGLHTVLVSHPDFASRETTFTVLPNSISQLDLSLRSRFGSVSFSGIPQGAEVKLNGQTVGTVPCRIDNLQPAEYHFIIDSPFHQRKTIPVTIHSGQTRSITVMLSKSYSVIELPDVPINVGWKINGEPVASGPIRFNPGTHRVSWSGGGSYEPIDTIITVALGDTVRVDTQFIAKNGGVKVLPLPMSCDLYINGEFRGEAPIVVENLPVGNHLVELRKPGYITYQKRVRITHNRVITLTCELSQVIRQPNRTNVTPRASSPEQSSNRISINESRAGNNQVEREEVTDSGELSFVSFPPLARVYNGDSLVAITGRGKVTVPAGRYQFRFVASNGTAQEKTVVVASGTHRAVLVDFEQ